jgi:ATP-dependent Clp protease adapter protein ClpS
MSYRKKTCGYCSKDHAILDCTKLTSDAKKAKEQLERLSQPNSRETWIEEAILAHAKNVFYSGSCGLNSKRVEDDPNLYIIEYDPDVHKQDLVDALRQQLQWRVGEDYIPIDTHIDPDIFDTFETMVDYDKRWQVRIASDAYNPHKYHAVIKTHANVEAASTRRAKKSCSYCRTEGHSVRTCTQPAIDQKLHLDAYKISAYLTARACSRFGIWTSSMIRLCDGDLYSFQKGTTRPFFFNNIVGNEQITTDDLSDCLYALAILDRTAFEKMGTTTGYYAHTARMNFEISRAYLKVFNLDKNVVDLSSFDDETNKVGSKYPTDFYPVAINIEHILAMLMEKHKAPRPKKDRYNADQMGVIEVPLDFLNGDATNRYRSHLWVSRMDLYDRKKRSQHAFEKIEQYVLGHQDILEKANKILNKK